MRRRLFALIYRPFDRLQRRPLARVRATLVGDLAGRVLEIGCGPGSNFAHYPPAAHVVATDDNPHMLPAAHRAAQAARAAIEVTEADATALPFEEAAFDATVAALVLCSVPDLDRAARELFRVLRPGGEVRLFEHVRSEHRALAALQRWLTPAWSAVADGCQLHRDPVTALRAAGFEQVRVEASMGGGLLPLVLVRARKPAP
ncbi:MAG: hypothetical protein AMXMBFR23_25380 [Chloroflexota bacterium]